MFIKESYDLAAGLNEIIIKSWTKIPHQRPKMEHIFDKLTRMLNNDDLDKIVNLSPKRSTLIRPTGKDRNKKRKSKAEVLTGKKYYFQTFSFVLFLLLIPFSCCFVSPVT